MIEDSNSILLKPHILKNKNSYISKLYNVIKTTQ